MSTPKFSDYRFGLNPSPRPLKGVPSLVTSGALGALNPAPSVDRSKIPAKFQMFHNDTVGDCTCAGVLNAMIAYEALLGSAIQIPDQNALDIYSAITGYNGSQGTDNGAVMEDVLAWGVTHGFPTKDYRFIPTWGSVDCGDIKMMATVIDHIGVCYQGVVLRQGDMDALDAGMDLDTYGDMDMTIAGGHALLIWGYKGLTLRDKVQLVTWGSVVEATWSWVLARSMESHALIYRQLLSPAMQGANWDALRAQNLAFLAENNIATQAKITHA